MIILKIIFLLVIFLIGFILGEKVTEYEEIDLTQVYISGVYDERDRWRNKINEKIKELREELNEEHYAGDFTKIFEHEQDLQLCIDTLQQLLQEER